jgi:hypothetical protein
VVWIEIEGIGCLRNTVAATVDGPPNDDER